MKVGIAADHGGFDLKEKLAKGLRSAGHEVMDFGAKELNNGDDYPDYVAPLAKAVARGDVERGIAICGSGVGSCIIANKVPGVRASSINDAFSAHQGVEDDNMNLICLGGRVVGYELAGDLTRIFLSVQFNGAERHKRRLAKIAMLEKELMETPNLCRRSDSTEKGHRVRM
jgi:ribose 5-phosphate isomerase B